MSFINHQDFTVNAALKGPCASCREGRELPFQFTMAFQPIVRFADQHVWGYEALVRGPAGESAFSVLEKVEPEILYAFDQACRVKAIEVAGPLMPPEGASRLSINFKPNAVYEPSACIKATLKAARKAAFDPNRLMFEFTEDEEMQDINHVRKIVEAYRRLGFLTAIDDFGSGYAGLTLLADLMPDLIKLDMALIRGIDRSAARQAIVHAIVQMCGALDITCLAEGIETAEEAATVRELGIPLGQGYYFAEPGVGILPKIAVV